LNRVLLCVVALAVLAPASAAAQSGLDVMKRQRELQRVRDEEERQVLKLVSKSGAAKERRLVRYTLTGPGDLDKILVRFQAPRDVENTALLTWEAKDGNDDQWLYLPSVKKPKRIAASGKKNRFMGTDFAYEDLQPENLAVHAYALAAPETLDGVDCFVIDAEAEYEGRYAAAQRYITALRAAVGKDFPIALSSFSSIQVGSNSYQASPWRADTGCAWWLLCQPSPNVSSATHHEFFESSRVAKRRLPHICVAELTSHVA
jgi:hypothetical protein